MLPLTILAAQKVLNLMTNGSALARADQRDCGFLQRQRPGDQQRAGGVELRGSRYRRQKHPTDLSANMPVQLGVKNTQMEKFRSLSGTVSVVGGSLGERELSKRCRSNGFTSMWRR